MTTFDMHQKMNRKSLEDFADMLKELQDKIDFKVSARGWCYQLEQEGMITKAQFDKVEAWINRCREEGVIPIDFTAEEESRQFSGVEKPDPPINCSCDYCKEWAQEKKKNLQAVEFVIRKCEKLLLEPSCRSEEQITVIKKRLGLI